MSALTKLGNFAQAFANTRIVRAMNGALIDLIPFFLIGAFCQAVLNLPLQGFQTWLGDVLNGEARTVLLAINYGTLKIITLAALISFTLALANLHKPISQGAMHVLLPMFTVFACYVIFFCWDGRYLDFSSVGSNGIFRAAIMSFVVVQVFFLFVWLNDRFLHSQSTLETSSRLQAIFRAILPVFVTILSCVFVRLGWDILNAETGFSTSAAAFLSSFVVSVSLLPMLITSAAIHVTSFFGMHGTTLLTAFFPSVGVTPVSDQTMQEFYLFFVRIGGDGAGLGLIIALFATRSFHKGQRIARLSLLPTLLNINEPLVYGFPVVLNPYMFIPFIVAPLINCLISYAAFNTGLIPPIIASVSWTTPPLISGYLATGSLLGGLLQVVCIGASALVYLPFVRYQKTMETRQFMENFRQMETEIAKAADNPNMVVITREDAIGDMAREVSIQLRQSVNAHQMPFRLDYQPKMNCQGLLQGSEALLRWRRNEDHAISPLTLVELMEENGMATTLGRWVAETAIQDFVDFKNSGLTDQHLSLNLSPRHLEEDDGFPEFLQELWDRYHLQKEEIELEITEHAILRGDERLKSMLGNIRKIGYDLAIDDLGAGYSTMLYVSEFGAHTVKIDKSLIDQIVTDYELQEICRSVISVARALQMLVVVEGVESVQQVDALTALGAQVFQGYFFSRPLTKSNFLNFALEHRVAVRVSR